MIGHINLMIELINLHIITKTTICKSRCQKEMISVLEWITYQRKMIIFDFYMKCEIKMM